MGDKKSFSLKYYLPLQENLERCDRRKRSFFLLLPYNPPISALEILFSLPPPSLSLGRLFFPPPSSFVLPTLYQLSLRATERFPPLPSGALSLSLKMEGAGAEDVTPDRPTEDGLSHILISLIYMAATTTTGREAPWTFVSSLSSLHFFSLHICARMYLLRTGNKGHLLLRPWGRRE